MKKAAKKISVARRNFLKSAGVVGAAVFGAPSAPAVAQAPQRTPVVPARSDLAETVTPPRALESITLERNGADFMVDVFKSLGFDYAPLTPANDYRALQESLVNYGGNRSPEIMTCLHEEGAVAMAHGYYKVEGKPLMVVCKGDVGLMHASMAIYNAFCDRVPVYVVTGSADNPNTATPPLMVRDYTKWDDRPHSLSDFAESAVRAYKIAMTPPAGPVLLALDQELQERGISKELKLPIPKLTMPSPPVPDSGSIAEVARLLVAANNPVIIADRLRTAASMQPLVELAEALQAIVISREGLRTNFPSRHPLHRSGGSLNDADLVLGLETANFSSVVSDVTRSSRPIRARTITITAEDLSAKPSYHESGRYAAVDLALAADAEATLPALVEAVKRLITPERKGVFESRGSKFAAGKAAELQRARQNATYVWDASPISSARLSAELWDQLRHEDWAMVGWGHSNLFMDGSFWNFDKPYRTNGAMGGGGLGYAPGAAVGAALAHRKYGRLPVNIQSDGDFMFCPAMLWTAAKYRIPLLTVMRNNRAYLAEVMEVQVMCNRMNRGIDRAKIGNEITDPNIDFGKLAQSMGQYGEGPIENPKDLGPAIKRAIAIVKRGEPALLDVIIQSR